MEGKKVQLCKSMLNDFIFQKYVSKSLEQNRKKIYNILKYKSGKVSGFLNTLLSQMIIYIRMIYGNSKSAL